MVVSCGKNIIHSRRRHDRPVYDNARGTLIPQTHVRGKIKSPLP